MANKFVDYRKELNNTPHFKETLAEYYRLINRECVKVDQPPIIKFDDIPESKIKYTHHFACKGGLHIGQRKLFLSELQFLTNYFIKNPAELKKTVYLVYAGSAPGHHTYLLSTFFPNVKFILVDPNRFELRINTIDNTANRWYYIDSPEYYLYLNAKYNNKIPSFHPNKWMEIIKDKKYEKINIFLIEDFFSDNMAKIFEPLNPIFWSDIRTNETEDESPTDLDFLWNSAQQLIWVNLIKPIAYMLKFRVPFYKEREILSNFEQNKCFEIAKNIGVDFIADYYNKQFNYLDGDIYMQAFAGTASNESRLCNFSCRVKIPNQHLKIKAYNTREYENKFFYYNIFARTLLHRENLFSNVDLGFDHCNDCSIESNIWKKYHENIKNINIQHCVYSLSEILFRNLRYNYHGNFYLPNIKHITCITNYIHIDKNQLNPKFSDKNLVKKGRDWTYNLDYIINNLLGKFPKKHIEEYKNVFIKSFKKNSKTHQSLFEIEPITISYNAHFISNLFYHAQLRKIIMIIRLLSEITFDLNDILIIYSVFEKKEIELIHNLFNINIYNINPEIKKDKFFKNDNIVIDNKIPSLNTKHNVILYYDYTTRFQQCNDIYDSYQNIDLYIKKFNPKITLLRCQITTQSNNCKITNKKDEFLQSDTAPIKEKFYTYDDVWLCPYDFPKPSSMYFLISKYKKQKNDFKQLYSRIMKWTTFTRRVEFFENLNADKKLGFDCCHDCAMTNNILINYCKKFNCEFKNIFDSIIKTLGLNFKNEFHGILYKDNYENKNYLQELFMRNLVSSINVRNNV